jgi:hypothetical protein
VTALPPDPDPRTPDGWDDLWDPRAREWVERPAPPPRPRSPLIPMALSALAGALLATLVIVRLTQADGGTPPQPEPPFESVELAQPPSAPPLLVTPVSSQPKPVLKPTTHSVRGTATWYADPRKSGLYAAAGPPLRIGDWRGRLVTVSAGGVSFRVVLSDWCACRDRVIDLSPGAFARLAPLSRGVVIVTVRW